MPTSGTKGKIIPRIFYTVMYTFYKAGQNHTLLFKPKNRGFLRARGEPNPMAFGLWTAPSLRSSQRRVVRRLEKMAYAFSGSTLIKGAFH